MDTQKVLQPQPLIICQGQFEAQVDTFNAQATLLRNDGQYAGL